jgi:hypothetical protein
MKLNKQIFFLIIILFFTLSERLGFINFYGLHLSLGDLILIYFGIKEILKNKIPKYNKIIILLIFISIFISTIFNLNQSNISSFITVPLRFYAAYAIINFSDKNIKNISVPFIISLFTILITIVFFSDAFPTNFEILNRNEAGGFIVILFSYYFLFNKIKFLKGIYLFLILLIFFSLINSRQLILGTFIGLIGYLYINLKTLSLNKNLKFLFLFFPLIFLTFFYFSKQKLDSFNEWESRRIESIINLEPKTNADMIRYRNILMSIDGFLNSKFIGNGPGSFKKNHPLKKVAHNSFFSALHNYGLLGFSVLILICLYILKPFFNRIFSKKISDQHNLTCCLLVVLIIQLNFIEYQSKMIIPFAFAISSFILFKDKLVLKKT